MQPLSELLRNVQTEAFRIASSREVSPNLLRARLCVARVRAALEASEALASHPAELSEQPLDRLLLHHSPAYVRTRRLALRLGVRARAEFRSALRGFHDFEPWSRVIPYSPVKSELIFASAGRGRAIQTDKALRSLSKYVTNIYHEQNHAVLWRLLRPAAKLKTKTDFQVHAALNEALTTLREY
ncbi:MAG TPA: hypothetical protein VFV50_13710, partial [Bdellovibrionales bacterium]|nr:hypothetical protein [Bdellovibrionales bacterium]